MIEKMPAKDRVAYVTNIELSNVSGGFCAMNRAMYDVLAMERDVEYIGPINPKPALSRKILSKAFRLLKSRGSFFFFSEERLTRIGKDVDFRLERSGAKFAVFHGFTPWIHTGRMLPYIAWSDCTFWQYVHIYHNANQFKQADLVRIRDAEAKWLRNAERVIFRSTWAASEAIEDYHLDPSRVAVVGNYGFSSPPHCDTYQGSLDFLMITTNFQQKGGPVVVEAFRQVRKNHPTLRLIIVGSDPGSAAIQEPGVVYLGWIDKSNPDQCALLNKTLSQVRCLVHPTTADTNPMVIIEAGYFGCPTISTRRFAIPELIKDGVNGILLDDPTNTLQLGKAMEWMLNQEDNYQNMRAASRAHMFAYYTRESFQQRLSTEISLAAEDLRLGG
jgi:glycosyltransferase involved in cell wall biosynthesis